MNILYTLINAKAQESFGLPVVKENYKAWFDHWIKTAETIREEFNNSGLVLTVQEMDRIINVNKTFWSERFGQLNKN